MALKMSMTCTRCHRDDIQEIESVALATAFEELQKRKAATLKKLEAFIATLPKDELPDFLAILGDKTLVHTYLCDPKEENKRSCTARVADVLGDVAELPPRPPRAKKSAADATDTK